MFISSFGFELIFISLSIGLIGNWFFEVWRNITDMNKEPLTIAVDGRQVTLNPSDEESISRFLEALKKKREMVDHPASKTSAE